MKNSFFYVIFKANLHSEERQNIKCNGCILTE